MIARIANPEIKLYDWKMMWHTFLKFMDSTWEYLEALVLTFGLGLACPFLLSCIIQVDFLDWPSKQSGRQNEWGFHWGNVVRIQKLGFWVFVGCGWLINNDIATIHSKDGSYSYIIWFPWENEWIKRLLVWGYIYMVGIQIISTLFLKDFDWERVPLNGFWDPLL